MKKHPGSSEVSGLMQDEEGSWLHRFCVLVSASTFLLVIAGGLVTSTDSGLAVPDWPLSYGQLMPPMVGGILYEHGHRMVATAVGFLTMVMAFWLWRRERRGWVKRLGLIALVAVVIQGVLGGITVRYLLPTPVSVAHATLAQSFFALTVFLALVTSPAWKRYDQVGKGSPGLSVLPLMSLGAILIQLILGAWMRHSAAGLAVPDFPLAYGGLWPSLDAGSIAAFNRERIGLELPPVDAWQIAVHMVHRLWAIVVVVTVLMTVRRIMKEKPHRPEIREPALILVLLILFQVLLGGLTVWTGKSVQAATAHVAVGALLLGTAVVLSARSYRLSVSHAAERVPVLAAEGTKA